MTTDPASLGRWKWSLLAIIPLVVLSLGPQIQFWFDRGAKWHGGYATLNADEFLYSGYLNALIDGRPRRNDPFTGRNDEVHAPMPESAFSIQVIPAYSLAWFARIIGVSASSTFIALAVVAGFLASLSVFWLLLSVTDDERLAATGSLFVLLAGTLCAGQGLVGIVLKLDIVALGLPFLRRYQPAASIPYFFLFCTLTWRALSARTLWRARVFALVAGLTLATLVFSYLYLWTAAAAWLVCVTLLCLCLATETRRRSIEVFIISGLVLCAALVLYQALLTNRSHTLDELQTLISTRQLDLFRIPEILGAFVLILLIIGIVRRKIVQNDPRLIFAAAFAVLPIVVFNQQIVTGRSMQPFHFETFITNYGVLISLVILAKLGNNSISSRTLLWIAAACFLLGTVEVELTSAFRSVDTARDEMVPALRRLKQLSLDHSSEAKQLVFSPEFEVMRILPTWTSQGTVLGVGAIDFGSATQDERKGFLFDYLYFSGATPSRLRELIRDVRDELPLSYYVKYVLFGHERVRPAFALNFQPVTSDEIERAIHEYEVFIKEFSRSDVVKRSMDYVIVRSDQPFDFGPLERWYERDQGERFGSYVLYRLKMRD